MPDSVPASDPHTPSESACPIVGIGASAGGLDAFERLLQHLPVDTGYACVLVQHLDANHPSSLSEILGGVTTMPVVEVVDAQVVRANHVYVIPPNTELSVRGGMLRLAARQPGAKAMPIDHFLQSLADDARSRAVGVVLSGNGVDGAAGLRSVKDAGGVTFAQDPETAEHRSMPIAAIGAGAADLVLSPESIAAEIARIAHHPYFDASAADSTQAAPGVPISDAALAAVCDIIFASSGIDFRLYRQTTVRRRLQRRLALLNVGNVDEYAQLLGTSADERSALQRDLLICVTSFFRDPTAYEALKAVVFPVITRGRPAYAPIRIWVPGCATGEEAYSIAMALDEFQQAAGTSFPVQIFASDINEVAIDKARAGRYPDSIAADVNPERLAAFFVPVEGRFQVIRRLREQCLFSHHNLLDDPPFSRLDLVSCRNVLIYLDTIQRKVIPLFHYALVDRGFLMLGRSETTHYDELFATVDAAHRIYIRRPVARRVYESFTRPDRYVRGAEPRAESAVKTASSRSKADASHEVDRLLLDRFSPPGVIVDEALEVLEFRGNASVFLAPTAGKAGLHLLKQMPDTALFIVVEALVREAGASGEPAHRAYATHDADGAPREIIVDVTPVPYASRPAFLVVFDNSGMHGGAAGATVPTVLRDAQVARLSRDLDAARARLVAFIDDKRVSDDENQLVAEDVLSANEELQSLTEELETAKEELQSANEELLTVNRELESNNSALVSSLELARSIVQSVSIPFIVIDHALVARQMNPAFMRTFRVTTDAAEGRPFYDMCDGVWDMAEVRSRVDGLLAGGRTFEPFELACAFPDIGMRTLVLGGTRLEQVGWMLLTVQDITAQREAEVALQASEDRRRQSEKMETVGRLAGGIAHDFNNLLTVILGNAELLAESGRLDTRSADEVNEIRECASRAASLTDQLLSFSRRKVLQSVDFDLNAVVADFEKMLRRLLSERIRIAVRLSDRPCPVRADSAEISRVVLNLCLNARDSMPAGGLLTIETSHVTIDEPLASERGLRPGDHVRVLVSDTGIGMDEQTRSHIFEPFFTTKDASKGAGLGLATGLAIVQQSGGALVFESALGQGSRFEMLLPLAPVDAVQTSDRHGSPSDAPKGLAEVVLLAEDEDGVRRLTRRVLERAGYRVVATSNGREALEVIQAGEPHVDLLVSDVLMPEMSGGTLVQRAQALRPELKVLFVSGHTEDVVAQEGIVNGMPFLPKPYSPTELMRKVRQVLDA